MGAGGLLALSYQLIPIKRPTGLVNRTWVPGHAAHPACRGIRVAALVGLGAADYGTRWPA